LLAIAAVLLPGCRQDRGHQARPGELVIGLEGNPTSLDPRLAQDAYAVRIFPLVFEGLLIMDQDSEPAPCLASSWEHPDPLTYVFHLEPGHRTAEGEEIKGEDVVYTFMSLGDDKLASPRKSILSRIAEVKAMDDYTVRFRLKAPYAPFLMDLALGILPGSAASGRAKEFGRKPFGSGPYLVESFEPGDAVVLKANPFYHGSAPKIPRLKFRVIPDDTTRVMALKRGEVQMLYNSVPPDDIPLLEKDPQLSVRVRPGINYTYLGVNLEDPVLKDLRVRQAIAHAIDRETIVHCLLKDTVTGASGLIIAPSNWAYEPDLEQYAYNPALAKKLLDSAGYPDPDADGPLLRFNLVYKTSQSKTRRWVADAIADELKAVGIGVEVRSYEWGTFFGDIRAGQFQIYSLTWVGITDPDIYYQAFHSQSIPPKGDNRNRYHNPEVDELAKAGRLAQTRPERKIIYSRLQKIIARDLPYVSLWYGKDIAAMDKNLKGFVFYPGGDFRSLAQAELVEQ
jgi:peptide/nickel transport system substrate-binding protein